MINAEVAHFAEAKLGEGCTWSPVENLLIWVDIERGVVHRFDHETGRPVSAMRYEDTVGNAAPRAGGGLALGLGHSVALTDSVGAIEATIDLPAETPTNRANDGAVDPAGRLFQGTMSRSDHGAPVGGLHRIDGDHGVKRIVDGVKVSNGMGWSLDNSTMYYIDTRTYRVDQFDFDVDTGEVSERRPFLEFDNDAGGPDGMTVDSEGCLWVAFYGGYHVQRFAPNGERLETVVTPAAPRTTCVCFGGPNLDALYITTASQGSSTIDDADEANSGALFVAEVDAVGRPTNLFSG